MINLFERAFKKFHDMRTPGIHSVEYGVNFDDALDALAHAIAITRWTWNAHPDQHFGNRTYSQNGEDLMVLNLFKLIGIDKPSYLDLGAHHPFVISNTALLYERGSRGVNVEANENLVGAFTVARPEDQTYCAAFGKQNGTADFYMYDSHSGRNTLSQEEIESVKHLMPPIRELKKVSTFRLEYMFEHFLKGKWPNFISCDIEGMDMEFISQFIRMVGKEAQFPAGSNIEDIHAASKPAVICVEVRKENLNAAINMMESGGFMVIARMGENLIFLHQRFRFT